MSRASIQTTRVPGVGNRSLWSMVTNSGPGAKAPKRIRRRDLMFILRNLATLLNNGVSLPRALGTLAEEEGLARYANVLNEVKRRVETGESFSSALARHPDSFDGLIVNQVSVGERSGTLGSMLKHLAEEQEHAGKLRSTVIRKLSYPMVLIGLGVCVVSFMLLFVIPVFQETYTKAGIPLPFITQAMIQGAALMNSYGWIPVTLIVVTVFLLVRLRRVPETAMRIDRWLLKMPLVGPWLRDIAVLQLMDVLGQLMSSGFNLAEALGTVSDSVGNRAVRSSVKSLQLAVNRGERFSAEMDRHRDLFPPVVSQLVIVGEKAGKLGEATADIRVHLRNEIERKTTIMVGVLEPVLTISLAAAIGFILLAIYLPMFDMVGTVAK